MSVTVRPYVEEVSASAAAATIAGQAYTSIRLYSATSPTAAFTNLVTTISLVANQREYSYVDAAGGSSTWYRHSLYTATGPVESDKSAPYQGGLTLLRLRTEAAREADGCTTGTCSALGTTTTLIDAALGDSGRVTTFLAGAWVYRPDAAVAGDKLRRVSSFTVATGTLTVSRAWTNAPASAEVYQVFTLCPPVDWPGDAYSMDRAIRSALADLWFVDQLNLGVGTTLGKRRFDLASFLSYASPLTVRKVWLRTTDSNSIITDVDADTEQRYWTTVENGLGDVSVELYPPPATDESVIVEIERTYEPAYIDTDVITGPEYLAVKAVVCTLYENLNRLNRGKYRAEELWARQQFQRAYAPFKPTVVVRGL